MSEELKPCPFCGSKPYVRHHKTESLWSKEIVTYTSVGCDDCDFFFSSEPGYEFEAPAAWNRRASRPTPTVEAEPVALPSLPDDDSDFTPDIARIDIGPDGYAHGHQRIVVHCGWCARPSALAIDGRRVKLVAMRTEADDRLLRGSS